MDTSRWASWFGIAACLVFTGACEPPDDPRDSDAAAADVSDASDTSVAKDATQAGGGGGNGYGGGAWAAGACGVPFEATPTVDGTFTGWNATPGGPLNKTEWAHAKPVHGKFGWFYLAVPDCNSFYMLNDWYHRAESPICPAMYNLFRFSTGNGAQHWEVRVYGDGAISVLRNGEPYQGGKGGFSYGPSPNEPKPHTIFEFGVTGVQPGELAMLAHDPEMLQPTPVDTTPGCANPDGALVREPTIFRATLGGDAPSPLRAATEPTAVVFDFPMTKPGQSVRMLGGGFGTVPGLLLVDGVATLVDAWQDGEIRFTVPAGTSGDVEVKVMVGSVPSNPLTLHVTPTPPVSDTCQTAGGFGCPCATNMDCDSGYCVDSSAGKVCTTYCTSSCPGNWKCLQVNDNDVDFLCLPPQPKLCRPCISDSDCAGGGAGNRCIEGPADLKVGSSPGSFCGTACKADGDCETGYVCKPLPGGSQCVPKSGVCTCDSSAIVEAASTVCSQTNAFGTCKALRQCMASGLSDCSAAVPAAEICNGIDDNCDGQTDEAGAGGCTVYFTDNDADGFGAGSGTCLCGNPGPGMALVGGDCDDLNASIHPGIKEKQVCDGVDNNCDGVTDEGAAEACNDGNACTLDSCKGMYGCVNMPLPMDNTQLCDDGSVCSIGDACVQGVCKGQAVAGLDDGNPCTLDACDPSTGVISHKPNAGFCDDGNACTVGDACGDGQCKGKALTCPTGVTCDAATCGWSAEGQYKCGACQ